MRANEYLRLVAETPVSKASKLQEESLARSNDTRSQTAIKSIGKKKLKHFDEVLRKKKKLKAFSELVTN